MLMHLFLVLYRDMYVGMPGDIHHRNPSHAHALKVAKLTHNE